MAEERVERRLTAILAADVAGYSRLMGADEEGTLAALKTLRREVADPKIKEHRGRIVNTTGDGLLSEFASVVDAVRCAIEVQREMAARNAGVRAERRIDWRGNAEAALHRLREIMAKLKLTVNEGKTQICKVPEGEFDFLGFSVLQRHM